MIGEDAFFRRSAGRYLESVLTPAFGQRQAVCLPRAVWGLSRGCVCAARCRTLCLSLSACSRKHGFPNTARRNGGKRLVLAVGGWGRERMSWDGGERSGGKMG